MQADVKEDPDGGSGFHKLSASRKRLHIFYLLNDVLHHAKYHSHNASLFSTFSHALQPFLVDLIQSTASDSKAKIRNRLTELLSLWQEEKYYPADYVTELSAALDPKQATGLSKASSAVAREFGATKERKELPFIMPSTHGDPSAPYFDLPAGNLMPHILPNSSAAIRPDEVRALQFVAGPADDGLVHALKDFLREVDSIDDSTQADVSAIVTDIDELGQISYQDENGDVVGGDTYYGWSRTFCEKMKKRRDGDNDRETRARSYSSSRSLSRSRSRSPRKRRRYSDSTSSRSASRSRSRRSRDGRRAESLRRRSSGDDRRRSRSRSYSPSQSHALPAAPLPRTNSHPAGGFASQFPPTMMTQTNSPPFHGLPNQIPFQPPLGPGGLPLPPPPPPPPPPNYSGPWPPNINFPPSLPFPAPPLHQGGTFPPRRGPPGSTQNWPPTNWKGKS